MIRIAPSLLAADFASLKREISTVEEAGADLLHLDVMDGHFVPNISFGPPVVKALRKISTLPFDVHLMISDPDQFIPVFAEAGADIITVHVEACRHLHRTVQLIKDNGTRAGVALNPATPLYSVLPILPEIDLLLVMSVNPGFGGQEFIPLVLPKIREARRYIDEMDAGVELEVDGGISLETAPGVIEAGARILVAGSAVFENPDPAGVISRLKVLEAGAEDV